MQHTEPEPPTEPQQTTTNDWGLDSDDDDVDLNALLVARDQTLATPSSKIPSPPTNDVTPIPNRVALAKGERMECNHWFPATLMQIVDEPQLDT